MTENELCAGCVWQNGQYCARPRTGEFEYLTTQRSQGVLGARLSSRCGAAGRFYEPLRRPPSVVVRIRAAICRFVARRS